MLLDAAVVDSGHQEDAVREARRVLLKAGMAQDTCLQVAAEAGYASKADLLLAQSGQSPRR